ncbi:hypothetical protein [Cryptosporangium aurantiacum]|uniref:Uncharacterized protein n=1 Tax=Cryptosporangium aurantiacum TaxID=134849 RepID=A0A1M7RGY0_9ACTN|nr:hypothetical protein [Cryptosporangium aurantiacum]SHN45476.1 hypothetical protein SAMN05443668_11268 [Cryptosporangium aurantiacum]
MSEPLPGDAVPPEELLAPEEQHTEAELAALAEVMPTVPVTMETADTAPTWPREAVDPDANTAGGGGAAAAVVNAAVTMAIRDGGTVIRPSSGARVRWSPIEGVADEYEAAMAMRGAGYRCLGVIGNAAHLRGSGGHTPWCSEGYGGRACRFGKVYAIDLVAPNMTGLERWLIPRLRAGNYRWVYYLNINGHQYTRKDSFRGRYSSADHHLHLSGLAGHESTSSSILRDWQNYRTNGGDDMAQVPQAEWARMKANSERARAQLDAIDDTVRGGDGNAYLGSVMRQDHSNQVTELKEYVDQRLDAIEKKLDALLDAIPPKV